jgi:hypothetical protein
MESLMETLVGRRANTDAGRMPFSAPTYAYTSIQPPRYLFTALKKSMIALFFPGHSGCLPVPSQ